MKYYVEFMPPYCLLNYDLIVEIEPLWFIYEEKVYRGSVAEEIGHIYYNDGDHDPMEPRCFVIKDSKRTSHGLFVDKNGENGSFNFSFARQIWREK